MKNFIIKQYALGVLLLLCCCTAKVKLPTELSEGVVTFEVDNYDFGNIPQDTVVAYQFRFINKGNEALYIKDVKAACGCTSPSWTKEAVNPGDTGYVEAKFSSKNLTGVFNKYVTVISNTKDSIKGLFISGVIVEKQNLVEKTYTDSSGSLLLSSRQLNFGDISTKQNERVLLRLFNPTNEAMLVKLGKDMPNYYIAALNNSNKTKTSSFVVKANEELELSLTINTKKKAELGGFFDRISLIAGKDTAYLFVSGKLFEHFDIANSNKENSPVTILSKSVINFGTIKKGGKATQYILLKNVGSKRLLVRKIEPSCYCVTAKMDKMEVLPGNEEKLYIEYDSKESNIGPDVKTIEIYTNDPLGSYKVISVNLTITN